MDLGILIYIIGALAVFVAWSSVLIVADDYDLFELALIAFACIIVWWFILIVAFIAGLLYLYVLTVKHIVRGFFK